METQSYNYVSYLEGEINAEIVKSGCDSSLDPEQMKLINQYQIGKFHDLVRLQMDRVKELLLEKYPQRNNFIKPANQLLTDLEVLFKNRGVDGDLIKNHLRKSELVKILDFEPFFEHFEGFPADPILEIFKYQQKTFSSLTLELERSEKKTLVHDSFIALIALFALRIYIRRVIDGDIEYDRGRIFEFDVLEATSDQDDDHIFELYQNAFKGLEEIYNTTDFILFPYQSISVFGDQVPKFLKIYSFVESSSELKYENKAKETYLCFLEIQKTLLTIEKRFSKDQYEISDNDFLNFITLCDLSDFQLDHDFMKALYASIDVGRNHFKSVIIFQHAHRLIEHLSSQLYVECLEDKRYALDQFDSELFQALFSPYCTYLEVGTERVHKLSDDKDYSKPNKKLPVPFSFKYARDEVKLGQLYRLIEELCEPRDWNRIKNQSLLNLDLSSPDDFYKLLVGDKNSMIRSKDIYLNVKNNMFSLILKSLQPFFSELTYANLAAHRKIRRSAKPNNYIKNTDLSKNQISNPEASDTLTKLITKYFY